MGEGGGGWGARAPPPLRRDCEYPKKIAHYMYGNGLVEVRGVLGVFWGGLGCFNGPHDGYANR